RLGDHAFMLGIRGRLVRQFFLPLRLRSLLVGRRLLPRSFRRGRFRRGLLLLGFRSLVDRFLGRGLGLRALALGIGGRSVGQLLLVLRFRRPLGSDLRLVGGDAGLL